MKKLLLFTLTALVSSSAFSGAWNTAGLITKVYPKPSRNGIYFVHESQVENDCKNNAYLFLKADDNLFKETYSLLLSAYASGKTVKIYAEGCQTGYDYPLIKEVLAE
ncbi:MULTISPECIES: hypothetical protein [Vibrio]|uniref:hypothetical protein n=1 Tax=Vibrio TaxID=662 RepID=UPI001EFDE4AE|nr:MULTISPECIES: hypothetical protein [Vibrio]MCG9679149.1 hypothetical protein [Vibrio sp. Isolate24]USD33735.1 hypothetical protein J8Z27_06445 [Vibrio sp. SCSIO 43186]USD46806.1 hypothetical protein J4N38_06645 [Vibrio sp. SCSIO 43145]USD70859.1 hypothetical protein J4N41_06445 [Vibrio sp. SCSIO 43139]USD95772.1 hypothetical protein CTT30_06550 [Vibrio coralliilyticus]